MTKGKEKDEWIQALKGENPNRSGHPKMAKNLTPSPLPANKTRVKEGEMEIGIISNEVNQF